VVVGSSALVAIVLEEGDAAKFITKLSEAFSIRLSAVTLAETSMVVLSRGGRVKVDILDALVQRYEMEVIAVDLVQALLARQAFDRYGKGRDKAGLNFGDCFTYAVAKQTGEPLLFKGNDFGQTDLLIA